MFFVGGRLWSFWGISIKEKLGRTVVLRKARPQDSAALIEKRGFEKSGTFPDNMKYADGFNMDAYWMMKKLKKRCIALSG